MEILIEDLNGIETVVNLEDVIAVYRDDDVIYFSGVPYYLSTARPNTASSTTAPEKQVMMFVNDMSTPIHRALHYVKCYALHFPDSGARDVAEELLSLLESGPTPLAADAARPEQAEMFESPVAGDGATADADDIEGETRPAPEHDG